MPQQDYTPWDLPDKDLAALPPPQQRWILHLKLRRRLYQLVAIAPLAGWLFLVAGKLWEAAQNPSAASGSMGCDSLCLLVALVVLLVLSVPIMFGSVLLASRHPNARVFGYITNIGINTLLIGVVGWHIADSAAMAAHPAGTKRFLLVLCGLAGLGIAGSVALLIANLRLAPYLKAEAAEEALRNPPEEEPQQNGESNREPPRGW